MEKKVIIVEDTYQHYQLIKEGVELSKIKFEIVDLNLDKLIEDLKKGSSELVIPNDIDLFIIDVSLDNADDELGLKFLLELEKFYSNKKFKSIVTSIWDKSEFKTKIRIDNFINKNNYLGFELKIKFRNTINSLWED